MSILLKHIFRNIKEKIGRSILIVIALTIATTVLVVNITLPKEIIVKVEETLRSVYGTADIEVSGYIEDFKLDEDHKQTNISFVYGKDDKKAIVLYGLTIDSARKMKLIDGDLKDLAKDEVAVPDYHLEKYKLKVGDKVKFVTDDDKTFEFTIVESIKQFGITAVYSDDLQLFSSEETMNEVGEADTFKSVFIDLDDDNKINEVVDKLKNEYKDYSVEKTVDIESLEEEMGFVSGIMTMIFAMSTIMIYFVIGSLNKIIIAERITVIGTFRSVGASKTKMNLILLLENAVYGVFAGIFGVILGKLLNSVAASLFLMTDGVELSKESAKIGIGVVIIGLIFPILLQLFISLKEILKANKKPIKTLIFNTQSTRYIVRKARTVVGFVLIASTQVLNAFNTKSNIAVAIVCLLGFVIGIACISPFLMQVLSKLLHKLFRKIGWSIGAVSAKNIGYNKMIISTSRLIVVAISLMLTILIISSSLSNLLGAFRMITEGFDILVYNPAHTAEKYDKLIEVDGVNKVSYNYSSFAPVKYNDGKNFSTNPVIVGENEDKKYFIVNKTKISDLKYDEMLIDEKFAEKNNLHVGDKVTLEIEEKEAYTYKIVDTINSVYFTTDRNTIILNKDNYIEHVTDIPHQFFLTVEKGTDMEDLKEKLKEKVKEANITIRTTEEALKMQEDGVGQIMSMFYVVVGLSVALSFIGIINNQIISFIQRKRELAILNSTCMSKSQIKRMLITETAVSNFLAILIASLVGLALIGTLNRFMEGISMYVEVIFDLKTVLTFDIIIYLILLLTTLIPSHRLNKINIVDEIKYE